MASSEAKLFGYALIGFFFGLFLFITGLWKFKRKKLIQDIPTSTVRSIAMGLVEICGGVVPSKGELLKSPFSNKDCVYYTYKIEEYRRSGKHSRWVTVKQGNKGAHFFLKDNTGLVLVDPTNAEIEIKPDFVFNSSMGKDPPQTIKDFLKENKMSFEGFLGMNKTMRYTERFISPGDTVYILGTAGDNPFVEEAAAKSSVEDIMIRKENNVFYISDKSEKEILRSLGTSLYFCIFGGIALSIVCLFIIVFYLNLL